MITKSLFKGELAQLKIQLRAAELGYVCSIPCVEVRYDIILDKNNKIYRGQIKYCNKKHGKNNLHIVLHDKTSNKKKYSNKEIDVLFVYIPKHDIVLAYPPKMFHNKSSIFINLTNTKSKNYYKNYIW